MCPLRSSVLSLRSVRMYIHAWAHMHAHTGTYTHSHTHTHRHMHTHTHAGTCRPWPGRGVPRPHSQLWTARRVREPPDQEVGRWRDRHRTGEDARLAAGKHVTGHSCHQGVAQRGTRAGGRFASAAGIHVARHAHSPSRGLEQWRRGPHRAARDGHGGCVYGGPKSGPARFFQRQIRNGAAPCMQRARPRRRGEARGRRPARWPAGPQAWLPVTLEVTDFRRRRHVRVVRGRDGTCAGRTPLVLRGVVGASVRMWDKTARKSKHT